MFATIRQHIAKILLIGSLICSFSAHADTYIFDIGGVLIDTDKIKSFSALGYTSVLNYFIHLRRGPGAIKDKFYEVLHRVAKANKINQRPGKTIIRDDTGKPLPRLMCLWLKGAMTCQQLRTMILECINNNPNWFDHPAEQQVVRNLVTMVFTPEEFIKTRKFHKKGIEFVKKCKREGHQVYILSNWDPESFELLKKQRPEFFALFDGIVISGNAGSCKPSKKIYKTLLKKYNLNPRDCWFIDDQKENIVAARKHKICSIWCKKKQSLFSAGPNFSYVANQIARAQDAKAAHAAHRYA